MFYNMKQNASRLSVHVRFRPGGKTYEYLLPEDWDHQPIIGEYVVTSVGPDGSPVLAVVTSRLPFPATPLGTTALVGYIKGWREHKKQQEIMDLEKEIASLQGSLNLARYKLTILKRDTE